MLPGHNCVIFSSMFIDVALNISVKKKLYLTILQKILRNCCRSRSRYRRHQVFRKKVRNKEAWIPYSWFGWCVPPGAASELDWWGQLDSQPKRELPWPGLLFLTWGHMALSAVYCNNNTKNWRITPPIFIKKCKIFIINLPPSPLPTFQIEKEGI